MNENNELLEFIYENSEMGSYTITVLLKELKNKENKIKTLLQGELKSFEQYMKKTEKLLLKSDIKPKKSSEMSKMSSKMGIMFETVKDNSDSAIAQMMVQGLTMGSITLLSKIDKYKDIVEKKYLKLAKSYLNFIEDEIDKLKVYM